MELGLTLPIWSIIPFVGMLLSIAIFPLVKGEWWEKHQLLVAVIWSLIFLVPFIIVYGFEITAEQLAETIQVQHVFLASRSFPCKLDWNNGRSHASHTPSTASEPVA